MYPSPRTRLSSFASGCQICRWSRYATLYGVLISIVIEESMSHNAVRGLLNTSQNANALENKEKQSVVRAPAPDCAVTTVSHEELSNRLNQLQLLLDVNNALVSNLELHPLLSAISASIRRVMQHDYSSLSIYDPELRQFRLHALDFPKGNGLIREEIVFPVGESPHGRAFTSRKPLLVSRLERQQFPCDITEWLLSEGIRSACWLPLVRGNRAIGVLNIASLRVDAFSRAQVELLSQVASQVSIAVENAMAFRQITELKNRLAEEKIYLEDELRTEHSYDEIVGESPAWKNVLRQIDIVAPTGSAVLILGETGTGKELIARAIHEKSRRCDRTFVKMSCAAVPAGLIESELFGHERGAFTGALARQIGRFELANHGSLFLDEVGDIPLELQPKLLRALQEREFERLGSVQTLKVDVRVITATNRDLAGMVARREFRDDLYYRLNVFPILLPPLRNRPTDIPLLVRYFVHRHAGRIGRKIETIPADAMEALTRWRWPGNVRELENFIERAVILSRGPVLQIPISELTCPPDLSPAEPVTLGAAERVHILRVLRECHGLVGGPGGAAVRLGINRSTLNSKMRRLGISRKDTW